MDRNGRKKQSKIAPSFDPRASTSRDNHLGADSDEEIDGNLSNSSPIGNTFKNLHITRQASDGDTSSDSEDYKISKKRRLDSAVSSDTEEWPSSGEESSSQGSSPVDEENEYAASGLKNTLHGNSYQCKILLHFLICGVQKRYAFRLATEMDAAGVFDDLVFRCREKGSDETFYRFLQAKHRLNEAKKIKANDLMSERDEDFSLKKYFVAYCNIKNHPELSKSKLKDVIIYTNIDFDFADLKARKIYPQKIGESDDFLDHKKTSKPTARYKLLVDKRSDLLTILGKTSDAHVLAKALADHVFNKKKITLGSDIFKLYLTALVKERVIDAKNKSFTVNFKNGTSLSKEGENLRNIFCAEILRSMKLPETNTSEKLMWKKIEEEKLLQITLNIPTTTSDNSKKTLPEVEVTDSKKISEFFNDLVFAVNQPNEIELGNMIARKLSDSKKINLKNAKLPYDYLLNKIWDWFKKKGEGKGKEGVFLSHKDSKVLFESMQGELNTFVCWGLTLSYLAEIAKRGVEFRTENQVLNKFLDPKSGHRNNEPAMNLIAAEETLLTAMRVHQTIRRTQEYKKNDSLMFLPLDRLLLPGIDRQVIRAFEMKGSYNLLVIECKSNEKRKLLKLYKKLRKIVKKNSAKRLVLITRGSQKSSEMKSNISFENCLEETDEVGFDDLTEDWRTKLRIEPSIIFQGSRERPISFRDLLENRRSDDVQSRDLPNLQDLIDSNTLVQLVRGDRIEVGNVLAEKPEFYINRKFIPVFLNVNVLTFNWSSEVIAISGISKEQLGNLMRSEKDLPEGFVVLNEGRETVEFARLCKDRSESNVHWLKYEKSKLIWKKSRGNIIRLMDHREKRETSESRSNDHDANEIFAEYLTEDQLAADDIEADRVVIISDTAGMGKTTVLASLAKIMGNHMWTVRVDLNDFTDVLEQEKEKREQGSRSFHENDVDRAVDFLVDKLSNVKSLLEKKLLKTMIKNHGEVAVLLDGFDEISPDYKDTVSDLLQALKSSTGVKKLFVSTRPHMSEALETTLKVFSREMMPFSEADQTNFLIRFWKKRLCVDGFEKRIEQYAGALVKKMRQSIDDEANEFTGNPLQMRMIAELCQDDRGGTVEWMETCEEFLHSSNDVPRLPEIMNVVDLYGHFIEKKYQIFIKEKIKANPTNQGMKEIIEKNRREFLNTHQELALYMLFAPADLDTLLPDWKAKNVIEKCLRNVNTGDERSGIVNQPVDGKPQFVHRTYAEYFTAVFLIQKLEQVDQNPELREFFVRQILVESKYKIIRVFLDGLLLKKSPPFDRQLTSDESSHTWKSLAYVPGSLRPRTIFQEAAMEGNIGIIKFFLDPFLPLDQDWKDMLTKNMFGRMSPLGQAIANNKWKLVQYFLELANNSDDDYSKPTTSRPLFIPHLAAINGNLPILKWLVEQGADLRAKYHNGMTPLFLASYFGRFEIVKWLIEEVGVDVDSPNTHGDTALHGAAAHDRIDIFLWLVDEKKGDLEAVNCSRVSPLYWVLHKRNWVIMNRLIARLGAEHRFRDGETLLQKMTSVWKPEDGTFTVDLDSADVNIVNEYGRTKLEDDIKSGNLETIMMLVEKKVQVHFSANFVPNPAEKSNKIMIS